MKVQSEERSTGMGATCYTAILQDGRWVRVSDARNAQYHGRQSGVHHYSVVVPENTPFATFYRSNSGKETVQVGECEFFSFEDAQRHAATLARLQRVSRVKLMNSAMMPDEGVYRMKSISRAEFVSSLTNAHARGVLDSYIGYPQNADLIKGWSGIEVAVSREQTTLEGGDEMLIMKLKYRPDAPSKGQEVSEDDFEFFLATYSGFE